MKTFLKMIVYLLITSKTYGQQDVLLSQYMFNHVSINPGYAGSKDYAMATVLHRKQWVGWEGAPESNVFSIHGPSGKNLGLGFTLMNDKIGVTSTTDAFGLFSYQLRVSRSLKVGFGFQGGLSYYNYKNSDLIYWDADKTFGNPSQSGLLPNIGTGAFLYSENFYAGVSVPYIIEYNSENILALNSTPENPRKVRHYFGETGVAIKISEDFVLKPSVLVKYVPNAPVEADFNLNALLGNVIWIGGTYRTNDAVVGIIELQLSKKLRLGYSYDYTLTDIGSYSSGSHEIMLGYNFGYDILSMKSPRYF